MKYFNLCLSSLIIICVKWEVVQAFTVLTVSPYLTILVAILWNLDINYYCYFTFFTLLWRLTFEMCVDFWNDSFQGVNLGLIGFLCFLSSVCVMSSSFLRTLFCSIPRIVSLKYKYDIFGAPANGRILVLQMTSWLSTLFFSSPAWKFVFIYCHCLVLWRRRWYVFYPWGSGSQPWLHIRIIEKEIFKMSMPRLHLGIIKSECLRTEPRH